MSVIWTTDIDSFIFNSFQLKNGQSGLILPFHWIFSKDLSVALPLAYMGFCPLWIKTHSHLGIFQQTILWCSNLQGVFWTHWCFLGMLAFTGRWIAINMGFSTHLKPFYIFILYCYLQLSQIIVMHQRSEYIMLVLSAFCSFKSDDHVWKKLQRG